MNEFIEEDWERVQILDSLYIQEQQREEEESYWQWEEEQQRKKLPARIEIITKKVNFVEEK